MRFAGDSRGHDFLSTPACDGESETAGATPGSKAHEPPPRWRNEPSAGVSNGKVIAIEIARLSKMLRQPEVARWPRGSRAILSGATLAVVAVGPPHIVTSLRVEICRPPLLLICAAASDDLRRCPTLLDGFRSKRRFDSRMPRVLFAQRIELPIGLADFRLSRSLRWRNPKQSPISTGSS
jgi:hypothetical protein